MGLQVAEGRAAQEKREMQIQALEQRLAWQEKLRNDQEGTNRDLAQRFWEQSLKNQYDAHHAMTVEQRLGELQMPIRFLLECILLIFGLENGGLGCC